MKKLALLIPILFQLQASSETLDPKFYANESFIRRFPGATALHQDSRAFVELSASRALADGDALVALVRSDSSLARAILDFSSLSDEAKVEAMKKIFMLEVKSFGSRPPELLLDDNAARSAFFDFDPRNPGAGKVILNPKKLFADADPYAALLLLVHETRHSFQFQAGFDPHWRGPAVLTSAYRKGFVAQRTLFDQALRASFCDFLTLNQEYEAFLFGNYVVSVLSEGKAQVADMGTMASQYIPGVGFRLDLAKLFGQVAPAQLLREFNELEKTQYRELYP